jgi:hypothetical protein
MATTWEFFYTVETYHDLAKSYDSANYKEGVAEIIDEQVPGSEKYIIKMHNEYQFKPSPNPKGITLDSNNFYTKPVAQIGAYRTYSKVPQNAIIIYYVKFYMQKKVDGVASDTYWLGHGGTGVYDITIVKPEGNIIDFSGIKQIRSDQAGATTGTPESSGAPSKYPGVKVNTNGGMTYKFTATFNKNAAGKTLNPPFTMSAKFKPDEFKFPNESSGTIVNPDTTVRTITRCAGVHPAITVSKAKLPPEMPATIWDWSETEIVLAGKPGLIGSASAVIVYDFCGEDGTGKKPRFYGVKTQRLVTPGKNNEYLYEVVECAPGTDTSLKQVIKPSTEPQQKDGPVINVLRPGAVVDAQRKKQYKMIIGNCTTKAVTSQDDDDSTTVRPPVETQLPTDKLRWNPPPHRVTATESFGTRMSSIYNSILGSNSDPAFTYSPEFLNFALQAEKGRFTKFEKLRIFQDAFGAKSLNRAYKKTAKPASGTAGNNQLWGFRATYNPTTFSYSTAANTDVDWTLGAKDPAILLAGNQTVSFDLYLNRIADLSAVNVKNGIDLSKTSKSYPRQLEQEEVNGIYHRGTEYDLEFLYRVITGDPEKKNLLLSPAYRNLGGVTADLGYTTAVPCWLYLNENMRYYGSVASIQVNHVMFDLRMVPMLSVVTITFARYPAADQGSEPKKIREKQQGIATDTKSN